MKAERLIPYYASDGTSLVFRCVESVDRLTAGGFVKPSYGRKGHLKAIWLQSPDGSNPIEARMKAGTKYGFERRLEHGSCWQHRWLDRKDEGGVAFSPRGVFLQVVTDCLVG